jgi:hypothetical protein
LQPTDLLVEVRDRTLARVGQIAPEHLDLTATLRDSAPGEWAVRLPAEHPMTGPLSTPGAGLIVTGPSGTTLFSGPTEQPTANADTSDPTGIVTVKGTTDEAILWNRLAYPSPTVANVAAQTADYDVRSGKAETVMHAFVRANAGTAAPAARRIAGLTAAVDQARGPAVTKSARFDVLGDLLREIASVAGLRFRVVQVGTGLVFEVLSVADRTATVRFDLANSTLSSTETSVTPPGLTRAIVAGQGEGADRKFLERTTADSLAAEAEWGLLGRVERFIDQRNTNEDAELAAAGDEALTSEGGTGATVKAVASDDLTMRFALAWNVGDRVSVLVKGTETPTTVAEVLLLVNSSGARVGATLGALSGEAATSSLSSRVSALERRVEIPADLSDLAAQIRAATSAATSGALVERAADGTIETAVLDLGANVNLDTLTTTGAYRQPLNANASLTLNYPVAQAGLLEVFRASASDMMVWQRYTGYHTTTSAVYYRSRYSGSWGEWKEHVVSRGGTVEMQRLRLNPDVDASLTSTGHPFQIGPDTSANLTIDGNEILARNNGTDATLFVNPDSPGRSSDAETKTPGRVEFGASGIYVKPGSTGSGLYVGPFSDASASAAIQGTNGSRIWFGADSTPFLASDITYSRYYSGTTSPMVITGNGVFGRGTSLRAAKVEIEDAPSDWTEKVMALRPRTWLDKGNLDRYADALAMQDAGEEVDWSEVDVSAIHRRIPGFVAEEVLDAGLPEFGTYDNDGNLAGLAYDRITAALVATVQSERSQRLALEDRLAAVEARLDALTTSSPEGIAA